MKTNSRNSKQSVRKTQKKENGQSFFNLFGAKASFTNEPLWYKLTVIIIIVIVMLAIIWLLKEKALPIIGQHPLRSGISNVISDIKGKAP